MSIVIKYGLLIVNAAFAISLAATNVGIALINLAVCILLVFSIQLEINEAEESAKKEEE